MKKLILTIIYIIPTITLIFAFGQKLNLNNNSFLESETKSNFQTKQEVSIPKETSVTKEIKNKDNLKDNNKSNTENTQKNADTTTNIKIPKESDTLTNILLLCTIPNNDNYFKNPPDKFSILSLDSANNKIFFTPIPLDTYVNIPNVGLKKLSDTYSWGENTNLLLKAIETKFDTNITKVIEINTESISEIIAMFNEIGIDMTEEKFLEYLNETKVSKSMAETIKSIPIYKYPKLINCIKPYIKTNIDTANLIKYGIITYKIVSCE